MDIKAIAHNLTTHGIYGTYQIYEKRKAVRLKEEMSRLENERIMNLLQQRMQKKYSEEDREAAYAGELKSLFIKEVFPKIYAEESKKPVEHKVVFMERGAKLSLSLKYMRNYIKENTDYEVKTFILQVRVVSDEQYYKNAKEYIREAATAKAVFICTANDLMGYLKLRPETTYIQLWHGCGVFKKVGLSTADKKFGKTAEGHKEYPLNTNYSYVTVASPELSWIFEESMGIDKDSGIIVPTGISRTDEFFMPEFVKNCYTKLYEAIPQAKDKKVILYAPTFRGDVANCVSPDVLDVKLFAENLGDDYILIFKHHQSVRELPPIPEEYRNVFAFDMTREGNMNINELMTVADICISDYSSVVFEYSLFERPIIFFTYDIEEYIDERGLYYDFDEITPGPMFKTNEEMVDYIKHIDERFDKQEIVNFKNRFMCCCDGYSSERILALIED